MFRFNNSGQNDRSSTSKGVRRSEMAFLFAIVIGLVIGVLVKKVRLGIILGLIIGSVIVFTGWLRASKK